MTNGDVNRKNEKKGKIMTEQKLRNILDKARPLMGTEGDRLVESYTSKSGGSGAPQRRSSRASREMAMASAPVQVPANCKLPKSIVESMTRNPITNDVSGYSTGGGSILDAIGYTPEPRQTTMVQETVSAPTYNAPAYQAPAYQAPVPQMTVDYNYIRSIINECIQANLAQIKEQVKQELLKESELRAIRLADGNKIQLIDNKSNLYESTLAFKKNIGKK